ncbi:MAG: hypothetical protein C4536_04560 [Actinobacteria bacterium]|nr:MAG: hypothetical protein C4536_04560 [Actinomycetota bacterium]
MEFIDANLDSQLRMAFFTTLLPAPEKDRVVHIPGRTQRLFTSLLLSLPRTGRYRLIWPAWRRTWRG